MKEATVIVDKLLLLLQDIPGINSADQVVDSELQIDEYTQFPVIHLREFDEAEPIRRGHDYKRTRRMQIDLYQAEGTTRSDRDDLLDNTLSVLFPKPTGLKLEGTRLLSFTVGAIVLEPEDITTNSVLTQIPITIEYTSTL